MDVIFPKDYENAPATPLVDKRYPTVRGDGDAVYLIADEMKHWVLSAEIYEKLGYRFGDEKHIEMSELANIKTGEVITERNFEKYKFKEEQLPLVEEAVIVPPPDDIQVATANTDQPSV